MARKRISEYRAKTLLLGEMGVQYTGQQINNTTPLPKNFDSSKKYVVKVDQGVKGRFKKGLVLLDQNAKQLPSAIASLKEKGYTQFLIEEQQEYNTDEEKYISLERTRDGYLVYYSEKGGINVENNARDIKKFIIPYGTKAKGIDNLNQKFLQTLIEVCDKYHFSFLEINPYIILNTNYYILDSAIEVDSTAEFFVNGAWTENDFTNPSNQIKTDEEIAVQKLAAKSQAAFSLEVLNPNGSIFMMLSGGGASIVLADEVHNQGYGKELANYGEYSGNPNAEETYIYAKNLLQLLLKSQAKTKVLIIAGGVANFTDVRVTFRGLIKALDEVKEGMQKQKVSVYVRRGGPYQEEGLSTMKDFLETNKLMGIVSGPEMVLTNIVSQAIHTL